MPPSMEAAEEAVVGEPGEAGAGAPAEVAGVPCTEQPARAVETMNTPNNRLTISVSKPDRNGAAPGLDRLLIILTIRCFVSTGGTRHKNSKIQQQI